MKQDIKVMAIAVAFGICIYVIAVECAKQDKVDFISRTKIFCKNKSGIRSVERSGFGYLAYCKNGDSLDSSVIYFDQEAGEQ